MKYLFFIFIFINISFANSREKPYIDSTAIEWIADRAVLCEIHIKIANYKFKNKEISRMDFDQLIHTEYEYFLSCLFLYDFLCNGKFLDRSKMVELFIESELNISSSNHGVFIHFPDYEKFVQYMNKDDFISKINLNESLFLSRKKDFFNYYGDIKITR